MNTSDLVRLTSGWTPRADSLRDRVVLIVATDGFEEWELFGPRQILQQRGAEVVLASLKP